MNQRHLAITRPEPSPTQGDYQLIETRINLHVPAGSRLVSRDGPVGRPEGSGAIFLDRDGVLTEDVGFLRHPGQLKILDGVSVALHLLQQHFYLVVVTNQSGIARGLFTEEDLLAIHTQLVRILGADEVVIDALYYCPHLPGGAIHRYSIECQCRKPRPGMVWRAQRDWGLDAARSYMIGDMPRDIEAGYAAGVTCIQLGEPNQAVPKTTRFAPDLPSAARLILPGRHNCRLSQ